MYLSANLTAQRPIINKVSTVKKKEKTKHANEKKVVCVVVVVIAIMIFQLNN
jgi:hypothetical protein